MPGRDIPLTVDAAPQQDALDDVQPVVRPRLEVAAQVVTDQPVVHEGLVLLVPHVWLHHLFEEIGVLPVDKETQLVAGVLGVLLTFLLVVQFRPACDEVELVQRAVPAQRGVEVEHLGQRIECLHVGGGDVRNREGLSLPDGGDELLFGKALLGIEPGRQPELARRQGAVLEGERMGNRAFGIERENPNEGMVAELLAVDTHHAVLVRLQVRQHDRRRLEEIEIGVSGGDASALALASEPCSGWRLRGRHLIQELRTLLQRFPSRVGLANGPGVQQQAGAFEHVARVLLRILPVEDVAVLVADLATGLVKRLRVPARLHQQAGTQPLGQRTEQRHLRKIARRHHVHPRQRRGMRELNVDLLVRGLYRRDGERRKARRFQETRRGKREMTCLLSGGDAYGDGAVMRLDEQLVVSRLQSLDDEETGFDRQRPFQVAGVGTADNVQERALTRGRIQVPHPRYTQRFPRGAVQRGRKVRLVANGEPARFAAVGPLQPEPVDVLQYAQVTPPRGVGLE